MEKITIQVEKRSLSGKGPAGRMRREGKVPGVFYGPKVEAAIPIVADAREVRRRVTGLEGTHLIEFASSDAELQGRNVLLKEVQGHPVTGDLLHADFYEVDLTRPVEVEVALHFVGEGPGVERGGILQPIRRELMVRCLPTAIVEFVEIDVSALDIQDSVHVEDLTLPSGLEAVFDENFTIVTVAPPTVAESATEAEGEDGAEAAASADGEAKGESGDAS